MPKISTNNITVYHKDIKKDYKVEVMYNKKHLFYSPVHSEFRDLINHLTKEELDSFHIYKDYESVRVSMATPTNWKAVVTANTELECLSRTKKLLEYLLDKSIQKRNVIIVFLIPESNTQYGRHRNNDKHPQIGLTFGLTYAVESSVGDKKVYSTYREYESFGEKRVDRQELSLYGNNNTIIPDTPQNRETLEGLYGALKTLIGKLKEITTNEEKLVEFIDSKVKLLN